MPTASGATQHQLTEHAAPYSQPCSVRTAAQCPTAGVRVDVVTESTAPPVKRYQPHHPAADTEGYVLVPNVEVVEEMADMISASRSYQANVEMAGTVKELALQTLNLGR